MESIAIACHCTSENGTLIENNHPMLNGTEDSFGGMKVSSSTEQWSSTQDFGEKLQASVKHWSLLSIRGVWLKIAIEHSELIPEAVKNKFVFHHAQTTYVMMMRWLPSDEPNQLPGYCCNFIGVGGFVTNDRNQLLTIKEKYTYGKKAVWKLPGGHSELGEELADTAKREVLEETGIQSEFKSIICFRHQHKYRFGQSDMYFVCHMTALTNEIKTCPHEIAECEWMDLDEYVLHPDVSEFNRKIVQCFRQDQSSDPKLAIQPDSILSTFSNVHQLLYSIHSAKPD